MNTFPLNVAAINGGGSWFIYIANGAVSGSGAAIVGTASDTHPNTANSVSLAVIASAKSFTYDSSKSMLAVAAKKSLQVTV